MTIIDRLEGEWAIIELGDTTFQFPRALLPAEAKPGDVIFFRTEIDSKLTSDRKERIAQLESRLFRR